MTTTRSLVDSLGTSDKILSGKPNMTYFREVFAKRSQFADQVNTIKFEKTVQTGSEVTIDLHRECDLITAVYLRVDLVSAPFTVYDGIGTNLINWAQLEYGDQVIERLDGEYIDIRNDIRVIESKQAALQQMVGKNKTISRTTYFIKLPFDIVKTGFPVCALAENPRIRFNFRQADQLSPVLTGVLDIAKAVLVVASTYLPDLERKFFTENEHTYLVEQTQRFNAPLPVKPVKITGKQLSVGSSASLGGSGLTSGSYNFTFTVPNDLYAVQSSIISFVFASATAPSGGTFQLAVNGSSATGTTTTSSRAVIFTSTTIPSLVAGATVTITGTWSGAVAVTDVVWSILSMYTPSITQPYTFYTQFTNPVKELFFIIQNNSAVPYNYTLNGTDQLVNMRMVFNGWEAITEDLGTPLFLRVLQPLENHNRSPDRYFYTYCFALDPENKHPTGSVNMTQIRRQQFDFSLRYTTEPRTIRIYARSYNVLKIKDGKLRMLFYVNSDTGATSVI